MSDMLHAMGTVVLTYAQVHWYSVQSAWQMATMPWHTFCGWTIAPWSSWMHLWSSGRYETRGQCQMFAAATYHEHKARGPCQACRPQAAAHTSAPHREQLAEHELSHHMVQALCRCHSFAVQLMYSQTYPGSNVWRYVCADGPDAARCTCQGHGGDTYPSTGAYPVLTRHSLILLKPLSGSPS